MARPILVLVTCASLLAGAAQAAAAPAQPMQPQLAGVTISNTPHRQGKAVAKENVQPASRSMQERKAEPAVSSKAANQAAAKPAAKKQTTIKKQQKHKAAATNKQNKQVSVQQSNWRLKVAQQKLQVLGLSKEKPNGQMTAATTEALKRFQKEHSLKAHGELDEQTYRKLTWEAFSKEGIKNVQGKEIVSKAAKYKGVPYVFGGTTPKGFDCSGYVQYVFKNCQAALPRLADEQALEGVFVTQKQLRPGDLVFFTTYTAGASHVGIYAGSGQFWSASSSKGVILSSLKDDYWKNRYYGARRVLVANGEV